MRMARRRYLVEAQPREQADGPNIARINGGEERCYPEVTRKVCKHSLTSLKGHSPAPVRRSKDKREIGSAFRVDGGLHITSTLSRAEPHNPVHPALTPVGRSTLLELNVALPQRGR